jgi:hypothetical protein
MAQSKAPESLTAKLWRWLRPVMTAPDVAIARGAEAQSAQQIVTAELSSPGEQAVWKCGSCWSLAVLDDRRLITLKDDGLWVAPLDQSPPQLAMKAEKLRLVLGRVESAEGTILLLRKSDPGAGNCEFIFVTASLQTGQMSAVSDSLLPCLREEDIGSLVLPDQVHSDRYLTSSQRGSLPRQILLFDLAKGPRAAGSPALRWLEEEADSVHRFNPVWLTSGRIAYLQRQ